MVKAPVLYFEMSIHTFNLLTNRFTSLDRAQHFSSLPRPGLLRTSTSSLVESLVSVLIVIADILVFVICFRMMAGTFRIETRSLRTETWDLKIRDVDVLRRPELENEVLQRRWSLAWYLWSSFLATLPTGDFISNSNIFLFVRFDLKFKCQMTWIQNLD